MMYAVKLFDQKQSAEAGQAPALCTKCGAAVPGKLRKIRAKEWPTWRTALLFRCVCKHEWAVM